MDIWKEWYVDVKMVVEMVETRYWPAEMKAEMQNEDNDLQAFMSSWIAGEFL